tara:strand:- start:1950 stop:2291 length:342 start_codon:yes stop_codon:yes gene_type:complete
MKKKGMIVKQEKSGEVQKLKNRIKRLEKENRDLISKLNTVERAFDSSIKFLKGTTEDVSLEDLIDAAKENKSYKEIKNEKQCPKCGSSELKVMKTLFGELESCSCGYTNKRII